MFDTILVPVDRSTFSEHAIPSAIDLAKRTGAQLHFVLVHTLLGVEVSRGTPVAAMETTFDLEIEREEKSYLEGLATRVHNETGLSVETALLDGEIARTIEEYIRTHEIKLVVMTTHGHGGLRRAWLGSVADRLVRRVSVPLLLIRPTEDEAQRTLAFYRVLVALDGSRLAERALHAASDLFGSTARATLIRVVVPPMGPTTPYLPDAARLNLEEVQHDTALADAYIAAQATKVKGGWLGVDTRVVASYHPADAILRAASAGDADLIVLGTHGRGPVIRAILGSVADKVIRGAELPIFVFPAHALDRENGHDTEQNDSVVMQSFMSF